MNTVLDRPNVLIISTHDSGRWFGCYGHDTVHTPNVDCLANEGVRLSQHFCSSPICSASRASMFTGCYPQTHGLLDLAFPPFDTYLNEPRWHLSHVLRDAGYTTHLFHLQHVTRELGVLGFDQHHAQTSSVSGQNRRRPTCVEVAEVLAEFLETRARTQASQPFYAEVGFFETHIPYNFGDVAPDDSSGVRVPDYLHDNEAARENCAWLQGALRCAASTMPWAWFSKRWRAPASIATPSSCSAPTMGLNCHAPSGSYTKQGSRQQ